MERMRQADGDAEKKHDAERRHQLIRYRLLAAFSGLGSLLDVVKDAVDDGVEVVVVDLVVVDLDVEIDLDADPGSDGGHNRPFQLPRGDCRPLSVWRNRLRVILSYHTRRGLNRQRET